LEGQDINSIYI